ncbi:MAG: cell division protein FtsA, partial [Candidatus Saccharimonadales bacterium]
VVKLPPNREIIQVFAKSYALDGQGNIKDPVGMTGVRLEVDTHLVTASTPNLKSLDLALEKAQIAANRYTVSSLAAAEAVMTRQQKEAGTAIIDIGAGTTNIAILEDGEVQHVGVLPIGSTHLTNDLAIGLKTDLDVAEQVKLKYASLGGLEKEQIKLKVDGKEYMFMTEDIKMITEARLEELFEYVSRELVKAHRAGKLPGGVVLVGGGSKIADLSDFVREQLGLPARLGSLQPIGGLAEAVDDPAYFTSVGLTMLDMLLPSDVAGSISFMSGRFSDFFGNLRTRFRV